MKSPSILMTLCLLLSACSPTQPPPDADTAPPLLQAAEDGDLPAIQRLIGGDSPVDQRDVCLWTPLMKAALNGHADAARLLIEAGADVNLADKGGYTPLMLAASNNHAAVVDLLLEHGAEPDRREQTEGFTALIWAAKRGHTEAVSRLLAARADPSIRDLAGKRAVDHARERGHAAVIALLERQP
ncbi:MAG: ankyrin repeat domain-containing protein [Candidatus Thiodiazotropha sp.]